VGKEYDRIKRYKKHRYKSNEYVEGYVPGSATRPIRAVLGDIIISNPIITEQVIKAQGTNYIQRLTPIETTGDGQPATLDLVDKAPIPDTSVIIALNGRVVVPGDGPGDTSTAAAWFESPGGTVRAHGAVQAGDKLIWNGSCAGVEVLPTDELIIIYEVDAL